MNRNRYHIPVRILSWLALAALLVACAGPASPSVDAPGAHDQTGATDAMTAQDVGAETLPALAPVALASGEKLRVVVTTNITGDVVQQIGRDAIDLTQLLPPGADPHSYQARPEDLRQLNDAHVVLINGLHLEESLLPILNNLDSAASVISINAGVPTLAFAGDHAHEENAHEADADPHTWMDVRNVEIWAQNVATVLSALDPTHAELYAANAASYQAELAALQTELAALAESIPADERKLVTDHDNLGYLANAYGFSVVGSVIPSLSTLASPSAQELAALQTQIADEGVRAIFVGTTVNPDVAAQIAADTGAVLVSIYTDSLSNSDGPAATYAAMMRYNMEQIVGALGD